MSWGKSKYESNQRLVEEEKKSRLKRNLQFGTLVLLWALIIYMGASFFSKIPQGEQKLVDTIRADLHFENDTLIVKRKSLMGPRRAGSLLEKNSNVIMINDKNRQEILIDHKLSGVFLEKNPVGNYTFIRIARHAGAPPVEGGRATLSWEATPVNAIEILNQEYNFTIVRNPSIQEIPKIRFSVKPASNAASKVPLVLREPELLIKESADPKKFHYQIFVRRPLEIGEQAILEASWQVG